MNDDAEGRAATPGLTDAILAAVAALGPGKTLCPSEVARDLSPANWRLLMPAIRETAAVLARQGRIAVTRGGLAVDALDGGGPIRLGLTSPGQKDIERA